MEDTAKEATSSTTDTTTPTLTYDHIKFHIGMWLVNFTYNHTLFQIDCRHLEMDYYLSCSFTAIPKQFGFLCQTFIELAQLFTKIEGWQIKDNYLQNSFQIGKINKVLKIQLEEKKFSFQKQVANLRELLSQQRKQFASQKQKMQNQFISQKQKMLKEFNKEKQKMKNQLISQQLKMLSEFNKEKQKMQKEFISQKSRMEQEFSNQKQKMRNEFNQEKSNMVTQCGNYGCQKKILKFSNTLYNEQGKLVCCRSCLK